jgi:hypothetical protein
MGRKPTIYEALKAQLGREPTHRELCDDVKRILAEGLVEQATAGKLKHQRKR